jgi:predicted transcriptional regulator
LSNWEEFKKSLTFIDDIEKQAIAETAKKVNECVRLRKQLRITQAQLAELTGLSQPVIARIENGRALPEYKTVMKIIIVLEKLENLHKEEAAASSLQHV